MFRGRRGRQNGSRRNPARKPRRAFGMKSLHAVVPFRARSNRQLISIPEHNHQLRLHRVFRFQTGIALLTGDFSVSLTDIMTAVRDELGIAVSTTVGETFAVHQATFYLPANASAELALRVFDIEETAGTGNPNLIANFHSESSTSGITHICLVHPVNNRPTFNRSTTSLTLYNGTVSPVPISTGSDVICDLLITYARTPIASFLTSNRLINDDNVNSLTSNLHSVTLN